ncbi:MAG TPA: bifunctional 4-hydroxy-2-oxoglutarate aldolase/2-dehydro-3-deoxy-phosphogluconate aldolase [Desulfosporosinus sp.]|nr:bifunctional 4-hydroxy-2-oxoglutarate aldolase/2-dehydro-3-deoxy-phosphogluconate aldolase [Desulfosporosinus sp.]
MLKNRLWQNGVLAILRGFNKQETYDTVQALIEAGIFTIEVTSDSPNAWHVINTLKGMERRLVVGAGSVLDTETARDAIEAGADFIFSPVVRPEVIQIAHRYGRMAIPGVMTPSEALLAIECGADIVKLFPAGSLGVSYLKEMRGPFPYIPFIPTGGVTRENAVAFIEAGAVAVGMGSALVKKDWLKTKNFAEITRLAEELVKEISAVV